ncbi:SRPBCC family protein [Nakamurella leprariae]|uniref:ATPase n=1 Tax=Nakamurella leprariae TaxID=2803911 RepID=A0A938Y9A9_9ACTN|nr:hypothetical protein [Nakamurella leprariae]MBM9468225.1 hypothetical protein [Nakamurella leprariae]
MDTVETVDRIEQSIEIAAPPERVFALISEPGWFINDERLVDHRIEQISDTVHVVHDPAHGSFAFATVALDPPRAATFRWIQSLEHAADPSAPSTLIEFTVADLDDGRVRLTVVESGFASLPGDAAEARQRIEGNTKGWIIELALARDALQGGSGDHQRA